MRVQATSYKPFVTAIVFISYQESVLRLYGFNAFCFPTICSSCEYEEKFIAISAPIKKEIIRYRTPRKSLKL